MTKSAPLILTLAFDERSFAFFDGQRRRHFPPERNFIPAHLTLFHHLPGEQVGSIQDILEQTCSGMHCFSLHVTGLRFLGRGVAYALHSDDLRNLRSSLAQQWAPWLIPQDKQQHQPHVTVQNKVESQRAKAVLTELSEAFVPFQATATGLDLWWYRGGPWEKVRRFTFAKV